MKKCMNVFDLACQLTFHVSVPSLCLQGIKWCADHDPHLIGALNKTLPVVSVLEDGTTVHLVGGNIMPIHQINIVDLPHPKHTSEVILAVEEISAVVQHGGAIVDLVDKVLFINSRDIRDTCSEAESFKVRGCFLFLWILPKGQ